MGSTLTVDIFVSVDGWASGATSPGYFGYLGPELEKWITTELAAPQLVVLGRRTYEALAGLPGEARDESWRRMTELDKVVFSRTLEQAAWPNTRICRQELVAEIERMKTDGDVPLRTMGSLSLARQLTDGGLVDRLRLMTFPLIAGIQGVSRSSRIWPPPSSSWSITEHWMAECSSWSTARPDVTSHGLESSRSRAATTHHPRVIADGAEPWRSAALSMRSARPEVRP